MAKKKTLSAIEPRKEPKQDRARQTYQEILHGASSVIRRLGVQKFSTNKVAEESGVSIGSLYQYFPSKEAIIAALVDQYFEKECQHLKQRLELTPPGLGAREILNHIFSHFFKSSDEDVEYRRMMVNAVHLVGKNGEAMKFHRAMAELLLDYMGTHYDISKEPKDRETKLFIVQYFFRSIALSSVDEDLRRIDLDHLTGDLTETLMYFVKVPEKFR